MAQDPNFPEFPPIENLPAGMRSRFVENGNGLRLHILECGFEGTARPCVLLLHGFPELAYNWHHVMPILGAAGYHVVAPDQRGYGRTIGGDWSYEGDLAPFRSLNLVRDAIGLVFALGYRSVHVVGRDFGATVAAWGALVRPDIIRSLVLMTSPFGGPPALRLERNESGPETILPAIRILNDELAKLPQPRKHYQWYYTTREANTDMMNAPQGLHAFLRGYYHHKSADWSGNRPFPLKAWTAEEFAQLPTYYVMDRDKGMAETVAAEMPSPSAIASCRWLPDDELKIYVAELRRTGFQGGLQWYRARLHPEFANDLELFSGRTIDVPACFISGQRDWGNHQTPGALAAMQAGAFTQSRGGAPGGRGRPLDAARAAR